MGPPAATWLGPLTSALSVALFIVGLVGLLTQRNTIRQVISLKIVLQGVVLQLIEAGRANGDPSLAQSMVISSLIVEAVVIAIALALIVNVYRHYPSGDVDDMSRLRG